MGYVRPPRPDGRPHPENLPQYRAQVANMRLLDRLEAEQAYSDNQEARYRRNLKRAKDRAREEGVREGMDRGLSEGHEEAMKHQEIYDRGVRAGQSRSGFDGGSQRGVGTAFSRADSGSRVSSAHSGKVRQMEKFSDNKSRGSSVRSGPRDQPPASYASSRGPSKSAGTHHG